MICDGYTLHGRIPGLNFSYRPALTEERDVVLEAIRFHRDLQLVKDFVRRHVWWSSASLSGIPDSSVEALFLVCLGVLPPLEGVGWSRDWEQRDAKNLFDGVVLERLHPKVAFRKCSDCQKWWYDEETGKISVRNGKKLLRPLGVVTVCQTDEGCPRGSPDKPTELSWKNRMAWKSYQEWKAVGEFPDDPIVRRNAVIIEKALRKVSSEQSKRSRHGR